VDTTGALTTQYTYEPFGATAASGAASDNSTQFTGRENDSTGLYYYRARYYSPNLKRFISEDPVGLVGGINAYAYVDNNPVTFNDASGLGWSGRADAFNGGQGFEIHVYNPSGAEAGVVSGTLTS
jgi:RHS repeat-associated protein